MVEERRKGGRERREGGMERGREKDSHTHAHTHTLCSSGGGGDQDPVPASATSVLSKDSRTLPGQAEVAEDHKLCHNALTLHGIYTVAEFAGTHPAHTALD